MLYPKNIYLASVDPMYYSHFNTIKTASELLRKDVNLVICNNALKTPMFTLEEKEKIAKFNLEKEEISIRF